MCHQSCNLLLKSDAVDWALMLTSIGNVWLLCSQTALKGFGVFILYKESKKS